MDVNSINTNINTINNSPSIPLDRSSANNKIEKIDDESLLLSVNQYNHQRDELSLNVQSLNNGIAISKISQNSLDKQDDFLKNIQTKLENLNSEDNTIQDKNDIKDSINNDLKNFNQLAYETKFGNNNLLSVEYNDEKRNIEINTSNSNFSIEKPDTPQIANGIFETLNKSNLNNPEDLENVINKVASSSDQVQTISGQFTEFGNKLEESAIESIQDQQNLYNENKSNKIKDFGKESSDFTKTNISANIGYLAASQANIVQEQSVRLLS